MLPGHHQLRANIRNFLLPATLDEMRQELHISVVGNNHLRAFFVQEVIEEVEAIAERRQEELGG